MIKLIRLLDRLFLQHLPPIPALNKWLACCGVLGWAVLGSLLHNVMTRIWNGGVLAEILQGEPEIEDAAGEAGAQENEQAIFRRKRKKRASRIQKWLACPLSQCWAACALFVTSALASTLGDWLQDEMVYGQEQSHTPDDRRPWIPWMRGDDRAVPTLRSQLFNNQEHLRNVQDSVLGVLDMISNGTAHFLLMAFPSLGAETVCEAMQSLVLETMGDLYMRFAEYRRGAYKLHDMFSAGITDAAKILVARAFHNIPRCCMKPHFEVKLKHAYPTSEALSSDAAQSFVLAWMDHQVQVTRPVEVSHRINNATCKPKGPSKPSNFFTVSDSFVCHRVQSWHQHAVGGQGRRAKFSIRKHPRVQKAVKMVKNLRRKKMANGSNPKFLFLAQTRKRLAPLHLPRQEF